jgi:hypothetical protein
MKRGTPPTAPARPFATIVAPAAQQAGARSCRIARRIACPMATRKAPMTRNGTTEP